VNSAGEVFVLDSERVQRFSPQGVWLGGWGRQGTGEGEFNNPTGICLDAAGSIYIADTGNHRVQKFDAQGKVICSWGVKGQDRGMLEGPCGLAVDEAGSVYIVEKDNNRVQLFVIGSFALGASKR
jgi:DNA-binding beta-propeller fold protein YncE